MERIGNRILQVGSRVHCTLYGGDDGIIFAINGNQNPGSVETFGGVVSRGGQAEFDVVFSHRATFSKRVPECIVRGVQWRHIEGIASAEEIAAAIAAASLRQANEQAKKDEAKSAFEAEVARIQTAPEYAHLKQGERAAVNIRIELKRTFPGAKFSARSDFSSVNIRWTDGPTIKQVEEIAQRYKSGSFNGMEDIYEYSRSPFTQVFGSSKYISTSREYSDLIVESAIESVYSEFKWNFENEGVVKPTVAQYRSGELSRVLFKGRHFCGGESVQDDIRKAMSEISTFDKPASKCA